MRHPPQRLAQHAACFRSTVESGSRLVCHCPASWMILPAAISIDRSPKPGFLQRRSYSVIGLPSHSSPSRSGLKLATTPLSTLIPSNRLLARSLSSTRTMKAAPTTPLKTEEDAQSLDSVDAEKTRPNGKPNNASVDPESDDDVPVEAEELQDALARPPPVNSSYLPLPWKGRLGYVSTVENIWCHLTRL